MRQIRYLHIADDLRRRIAAGEFDAGLLPSEAMLSGAYGASRVTVRRALEALRDDGLVSSRQGFGWFLPAAALPQSLGHLGTIEASLATAGVKAERRVLDFAYRSPPAAVAKVLGPDTVLEVRRLNLADGVPFARVTVWCPEVFGAELSRADVERSPFYELLPVVLGGAQQSIGAALAGPDDAGILGVPVSSPVLRCWRTTTSVEGEAVLVSEHVFPAHRTEFVVELPRSAPSMAPSGLRLVTADRSG